MKITHTWRDQFPLVLALAILLLVFLSSSISAQESSNSPHEVLVVIGAPGEQSYLDGFLDAAQDWEDACQAAGIDCAVVGHSRLGTPSPTKDKIESWLSRIDPDSAAPAWIVYLSLIHI